MTPGTVTEVMPNDEQASLFPESNPYLGNYFKKLIQEGIAEGTQRVVQKAKGRSSGIESPVNPKRGVSTL